MSTIKTQIEPHYAGGYRLEYDGKYITLFGRNRNYESWFERGLYDETVLVPCVLEVRGADPTIKEVTDTEIIIEY